MRHRGLLTYYGCMHPTGSGRWEYQRQQWTQRAVASGEADMEALRPAQTAAWYEDAQSSQLGCQALCIRTFLEVTVTRP